MHPTVGCANPGQAVLSCTTKQANQAMKRSTPQWFLLQCLPSGFCLDFLPLLPLVMKCDLEAVSRNKPLLNYVTFCFAVLIIAIETLTETEIVTQEWFTAVTDLASVA